MCGILFRQLRKKRKNYARTEKFKLRRVCRKRNGRHSQAYRSDRRGWKVHRHHRPERRRQNDACQSYHGPCYAHRRPDYLERRGYHGPFHHRTSQARHLLRLPAAAPVQGHPRLGPSECCSGQDAWARRGMFVSHESRPLRQRLPEPRCGHQPFRRRGQAHRDRDDSCQKREPHALRRA